MSAPLISIVTPSLNQGRYLERTIRSVIAQEYPNLEYVVIDGGSTDDSASIIERYSKGRIIAMTQAGRGVASALNQAFRKATGEIIGWINADDVYFPNTLKIVGQIFADYPQIEWLTSHSINISADDQLFILQPARKTFAQWSQLAHRSPPPQHCTFWRRSLWERAGSHLQEGNRFMDCELWLRFHEHAKLYIADTLFGAWRIHKDSYSMQRLRNLHQAIDNAQATYLKQYVKRGWRKCTWPLTQAYLRHIDRGLLSRLLFECYGRRSQFLMYSLSQERFVIGHSGGIIPRAWPMTIELPESTAQPVIHGSS